MLYLFVYAVDNLLAWRERGSEKLRGSYSFHVETLEKALGKIGIR